MTIEDLARDVESLKAENRCMKRWGAGVLLLGLAIGGMAMAQEEKVPEVVRARRFEVPGKDGQPVVLVGTDGDGSSGIFVGKKGEERMATLHIDGSGQVRLKLRHVRAEATVELKASQCEVRMDSHTEPNSGQSSGSLGHFLLMAGPRGGMEFLAEHGNAIHSMMVHPEWISMSRQAKDVPSSREEVFVGMDEAKPALRIRSNHGTTEAVGGGMSMTDGDGKTLFKVPE